MKASISFPELQNIIAAKANQQISFAFVLVQVSAGMGTDTMVTTLLGLLKNKIPDGLIEKRPESQLLIHLGQIENMRAVFDNIDIRDLHVLANGLEAEGNLK